MLPGYATQEATGAFSSRFPVQRDAGFYRQAQSLEVSSLGLGSYLGDMDDRTDQHYTGSVIAAVRSGLNFIDTSLNYRHQRSERAIGAAIAQLVSNGEVSRDALVIATKAGYLVPDATPAGLLHFYDVVAGTHCITPAFLADQLERSRRNLGLETIDIFYLHNPETQLGPIPRQLFEDRIRTAFEALELMVADRRIRYYGTATWDGLRKRTGLGMSLVRLGEIAHSVAGDANHFRFVQLPYNFAMNEAFTLRNEPLGHESVTVLNAAAEFGINVVASASLLQARLASNLPPEMASHMPGLTTDAQRALQFSRSAPGLTASLVGMSNPEHVRENLALASVPPLTPQQYASLFARTQRA